MPRESYEFSASGHPDVVSAFRSVGQAAARAGTQADRAFEGAPKAARRSGRKVVSEEQKTQQKRIRALEKGERQRAQRIKASQDRELRQLEQKLAKEGRAEKRAAATTRRVVEREAKAKTRAVEREAKKAERAENARLRKRRRAIGGALGGAGRAAIRGVGVVGAAAAGVAGLLVRDSIRLQDRSTRIGIKGGGKFSGTELRKGFERTAMQVRGSRAEDVASGVDAFVTKTGDIDAARKFQRVFAEISVATGTALEDIGGAAADLFEKFDIRTVEDMGKAMATLAVQGKRGAFELEDAASQFPKLASAAKRFGLGGMEGLATLGGLTQIARQGVGSGEDATTAVENMFAQLQNKSSVIKRKLGVDVFTDKGKTKARDIRDVLTEVIGGAKGNIQTLNKLFGKRGIRAVSPLISTFNQASGAATGTEAEKTAAGMKALRFQIDKAIDATGAEAEIRRDLATVQQTTGAQLTAAWETLRAAAGDRLAPKIAELAGTFANFIETTDFSGLETVFVAIAEAGELAARALGFFSDKAKSPAEQIQDADRKLERIDRVRDPLRARSLGAGAALSNVEWTQLQALDKEEAGLLQQRSFATRKKDQLEQGFASRADFAEQFVMARPEAQGDDTMSSIVRATELARGNRIAKQIISDPTADTLTMLDTTDAQKREMQSLRDQVTRQRTGTGGGGENALKVEGANVALKGVAAAAAAAALALKGVKPPPATAFHDGS